MGFFCRWQWAAGLGVVLLSGVVQAQSGALRAGASKADITPENLLPFEQNAPAAATYGVRSFVGVHDRIWARALVVDNGANPAVIVTLDLEKVPRAEEIVRRITAASGIAPERIVISATHTHDEPMTMPLNREQNPKWQPYFELIAQGAVKAVVQAKQALQPARMGYVSAAAPINVNNDDGGKPGDRSLPVLKFDTLSGEPIGLVFNYAMESSAAFRVLTRPDGYEISGDIVGIAASLIEKHYKNKAVALYTMGAGAMMAPQYGGAYKGLEADGAGDFGASTWAILEVQARKLADEVVNAADRLKETTTEGRIWGGEKLVNCPGQLVKGKAGESAFERQPRDSVAIRLGLLVIDDVALAAVNGELYPAIGQRVRSEGAFKKVMVVTQSNSTIGYIVPDAGYVHFSHSLQGDPLQPGCAEPGIVGGFQQMMLDSLKSQ